MLRFQRRWRGFESRTEHHADVAQRQSAALPWRTCGFNSRRRLHAALAQMEERRLGKAKAPGSIPGRGSVPL